MRNNYTFKDSFTAHKVIGIPVLEKIFSDYKSIEEDLEGMTFQNCTFENVTFERCDFQEVTCFQCVFNNCVFDDCVLRDTNFFESKGRGIKIQGKTTIEQVMVSESKFDKMEINARGSGVTFYGCKFGELSFGGPGKKQIQLTYCNSESDKIFAESVDWINCNLVEIDFNPWKMTSSKFEKTNFISSKGDKIDFFRVELLKCNFYNSEFKGAKFRNVEQSIFAECDLENASFITANAQGALFPKAKANRANFTEADLTGAIFSKAVLQKAVFTGVSAVRSVWIEADLTDASMDNGNFTSGVFSNAIMKNTNVNHALFINTDLHGVDEPLIGANKTGARDTVQWRADKESHLKKMDFDSPEISCGLIRKLN